MEVQMSPEIMDHARGLSMADRSEPVQLAAAMTVYQCKLYRARLRQASESRHANPRKRLGFDQRASLNASPDFAVR